MSVPDVAYFTTADVDLLVGFLDSIHVEFGAEARRDGIISIQVRRVSRQKCAVPVCRYDTPHFVVGSGLHHHRNLTRRRREILATGYQVPGT